MVKLVIEGQAYPIDEQTQKLMEFVGGQQAIEGVKEEITVDNVDKESFQRFLQMCKVTEFNFPEVAKVKSSDPRQYIGNNLTDFFSGLSNQQINKLFKTAHILQAKPATNCILAFLSCKVYIPLSLEAYEQKIKDLGIKQKLTQELSEKYRSQYTFLG